MAFVSASRVTWWATASSSGASARSGGVTTTCAPIARARSSRETRRGASVPSGSSRVTSRSASRQRFDAGVADRHEAVGGDAGTPRIGEPSSPGLDHDDSEMMGDDVVQVARDPRPLALHREADERLLLGLERAGPVGELADEPAAAAYLHAAPPGRQRRDRDLQVGGVGEADVDLHRRHSANVASRPGRVAAWAPQRVRQDDRQHVRERTRRESAGEVGRARRRAVPSRRSRPRVGYAATSTGAPTARIHASARSECSVSVRASCSTRPEPTNANGQREPGVRGERGGPQRTASSGMQRHGRQPRAQDPAAGRRRIRAEASAEREDPLARGASEPRPRRCRSRCRPRTSSSSRSGR